jgi:hypothetical protein
MDPKTIAALAVTVLAGVGAALGHSLNPDQQSQLITGLTGIATGVSLIAPIVAGLFHRQHVKSLTDSSNPTSQKAG